MYVRGGLQEIEVIMVVVGERVSPENTRRKKNNVREGAKSKLILIMVMHS